MNRMTPQRAAIHTALRDGGFIDALRAGGRGLERVLAYVEAFAHPESAPAALPRQYPDYPLFPGLRHRPYHDVAEIPGAAILEGLADEIRAEWDEVGDVDPLRYAPGAMTNAWHVNLFRYMGVDLDAASRRYPRTAAALRDLPGACLDYPWADALLSVHEGRSHLRAHCSVDNLRVRCHLALRIPAGCRIRVQDETRSWTPGKALLFEDSFEHEVWNDSDDWRAILIVDFWHPDLTDLERQALTAGFARASVRRQFMRQRLEMAAGASPALFARLDAQVESQEQLPERARFWHAPATVFAPASR